MIGKLSVFFKNPLFYLLMIFRNLHSIFLFPFRSILFKKIGLLTYISTKSSIRNHKAISIGNYAQINPFVTLWPSKLIIKNYSQINPGTSIYGNVSIGNHVMIAPNCMIAGGNHNFQEIDRPIMLQGSTSKGIIIQDDVWIGANTTIIDGVEIGKGSVVGAHSNVTKNIPPYSVAYGNPAIIVKQRI